MSIREEERILQETGPNGSRNRKSEGAAHLLSDTLMFLCGLVTLNTSQSKMKVKMIMKTTARLTYSIKIQK